MSQNYGIKVFEDKNLMSITTTNKLYDIIIIYNKHSGGITL